MRALWSSDLLERAGLLMGFASFWLAAPELLGEERMQRLDSWISRRVKQTAEELPEQLEESDAGLREVSVSILFWAVLGAAYLSVPQWNKGQPQLGGLVMLAVVFATLICLWGAAWIARVLLPHFANEAEYRHRYLMGGAVLFALSWLLQFVATFAP